MSFDLVSLGSIVGDGTSQSLWNRAMSFDTASSVDSAARSIVSIPLEQGNVFRL